MDRYQRLERMLETNFKLTAIQSRELGAEMRRKLQQQSDEFRQGLDQVSRRVEAGFSELGQFFEGGMNAQADRYDNVIELLRALGDSSVDINKEIAELKRRVKQLEDRAS